MTDETSREIRKRLTRRQLLKAAVAAGFGVAGAAAVAGCAPSQPAPSPAGGAPSPAAGAPAPAASAAPKAAAGAPKQGGTVVIANANSDMKGFNQAIFYDSAAWFASTSIFGRLTVMDYGPAFDIHPQLARSWDISPDGKVYTFKLANNVKWHDGKPFTAADVKFTYLGIVEQHGPAETYLKDIESIDTPDDYTVKINLKAPNAAFLYAISVYPRLPIIPKHLYDGTKWLDNPNNTKPVGTGPFKFGELVSGDHFTAVANEDYFEGRPYLDKVIWKFVPDERAAIAGLQGGEFAALDNPPSLNLIADMRKQPGVEVDAPPGPWGAYLGFNMTKKPLDNVDVRWALAYAIDQNDVTQKVTGGVAPISEGPFTKGIKWAWNPDVKFPKYDAAKSEDMLDKAGLKRGSDGTRFKMGLTYVSSGFYPTMAEVLKAQLAKVGVVVNLQALDNPTFLTAVGKLEHDLVIYALWIGPDPNEWRQQLEKGGFRNWFGYVNPEVEALFDQGVRVVDREQRKLSYYKIQEIVNRDMPRYNIFDAPYSFAHRTEYKGWFSDEGTISYRMDMAKVYKAS